MKNRTELAEYFAEIGFQTGAEIGVEKGYYSETLCQKISNLKLYCIDLWEAYKGYHDFMKHRTFDTAYKTAKNKLAIYDCELIKKLSMDAVKEFTDDSLDFVYIDGNHAYEYVRDDIREWSKKVRKGGIISGHDYYITPKGNVGVIKAVNEYTSKYKYNLKLTDWDKKNPNIDERQPSWFFVKL